MERKKEQQMNVKRQTEAPVFLGRGDIPETLTNRTALNLYYHLITTPYYHQYFTDNLLIS